MSIVKDHNDSTTGEMMMMKDVEITTTTTCTTARRKDNANQNNNNDNNNNIKSREALITKIDRDDFDDGHIPENCTSRKTKLVEYPHFHDAHRRLPQVQIIDDVIPKPLMNQVYDHTTSYDRPWGTYVSMKQIEIANNASDTNNNDLYVKKMTPKEKIEHNMALQLVQYYLQCCGSMNSQKTNNNDKVQTFYHPSYNNNNNTPNDNNNNNNNNTIESSSSILTLQDIDQHVHGVAVWALASNEKCCVPYHMDYAEQIRYEQNIIVPPFAAGTLQCTPFFFTTAEPFTTTTTTTNSNTMKGGSLHVNLDGFQHYEKHGYKRNKTKHQSSDKKQPKKTQSKYNTPNDTPNDDDDDDNVVMKNEPNWIPIPYRYNRMICMTGHLPHYSSKIQSITSSSSTTVGDDNNKLKRVIVGFNVFGHDYGPTIQVAPEHSDTFRKRVKLLRLAKNKNNNNNTKIPIHLIKQNKSLTKLLVLAKREKIKQQFRQRKQELDQQIDEYFANVVSQQQQEEEQGGVTIQTLMNLFGTNNNNNNNASTSSSPLLQTTKNNNNNNNDHNNNNDNELVSLSPVDIHVHIHHRLHNNPKGPLRCLQSGDQYPQEQQQLPPKCRQSSSNLIDPNTMVYYYIQEEGK